MEKEILSLKDVAEYLGVRIGTAHNFIKRGMPVVRVGRKIIKVRRQDLLDWIASHVVPEIESGNRS